jgi:isopenicillin N synthase-like dioxygenase
MGARASILTSARGPGRWPAAIAAARRAAAAYRANRQDLEPVIRLLADVLALAALVRGRNLVPRTAARARKGAAR